MNLLRSRGRHTRRAVQGRLTAEQRCTNLVRQLADQVAAALPGEGYDLHWSCTPVHVLVQPTPVWPVQSPAERVTGYQEALRRVGLHTRLIERDGTPVGVVVCPRRRTLRAAAEHALRHLQAAPQQWEEVVR